MEALTRSGLDDRARRGVCFDQEQTGDLTHRANTFVSPEAGRPWDALDGCPMAKEVENLGRYECLPRDDNCLRKFLAGRQKARDSICVNCVRHLYADDGNA